MRSTPRPGACPLAAAVSAAVVMVGCPRGAAPEGDAHTATAPTLPEGASSAPASSLPEAEIPSFKVVNGSRYAVQVYATRDASDAQARLQKIEKAGYPGTVATVDLGPRGVWYRLLLGSHSRQDLAQIHGDRLSQEQRLRAILPTPGPGEPFFIVQAAPPAELAPRAARALVELARGREVSVAIARYGTDLPSGALVAVSGDARVRTVDAAGALGAPLPQPRFLGCSACQSMAASTRIQGVEILAVDDLSGDVASEVLLRFNFGPHRAAASLYHLRPSGPVEIGGVLLESQEPHVDVRSDFALIDADGQPDAELLVVTYRAVTHEGDLCEVQRRPRLFEIDRDKLIPLDDAHFAKLGASPEGAGVDAFSSFLDAAEARRDAELLVPAAVAFLAQDAALPRGELRERFLRWLRGLRSPEAKLVRVQALAQLAGSGEELRSSLEPDLARELQSLLDDPAAGVRRGGCDDTPLASAKRWSDTVSALERYAARTRARADLRAVPNLVFEALARGYPPESSVGQKLDALVVRLKAAPAHHGAVQRLIQDIREGPEQERERP